MAVTDGEIFARLGAVEQALATVTERQAGFTKLMDERTQAMAATQEKILTHVATTNGEVATIKAWQNRTIGAVGVLIAFMSLIVAPLAVYGVVTLVER